MTDSVYLDNAATTFPKPDEVIDGALRFSVGAFTTAADVDRAIAAVADIAAYALGRRAPSSTVLV
jgi:cysteine sulfinate desulfinase/cysteine desulfurase-like protein